MIKKVILVGKGRIGGLWCENFHCINEDGTIGDPQYSRKMSPKEREQIIKDIARNREKLMEELAELDVAQKIMDTTNQVTNYEWD